MASSTEITHSHDGLHSSRYSIACRYALVAFLLSAILAFGGCLVVVPNNKPGCTDAGALNHDPLADLNDGSCRYSSVVFYASTNRYEYIPDPDANQLFIVPIKRIVVTVNGSTLGDIRRYYPNGPSGCSAPGTLTYVLDRGKGAEWVAIVLLDNGRRLIRTGTVSPDSLRKCIAVNVTSN